jgi:hypothetical protein
MGLGLVKNSLPFLRFRLKALKAVNNRWQPVDFQGWQGTTGYAVTLPAGTYWISFEVPNASPFAGALGGNFSRPAIFAMSPEAYTRDGLWYNFPLNIAARIESATAPLPSTIMFLGSGLLGLLGWRRTRKS